MKNRALLIGLPVVLSAMLIFVIGFWEPQGPPSASSVGQQVRLATAAPPAGGDFTLQGPRGPVALADYRGRVVLIYFGYTYCPDVCPTSLALIAQALSGLQASERQRVQALFISVDPQRDSAARLQEYAPFFHPALVGLSGTPREIAGVAAQYGASYQLQAPNAQGQYTVDHSSATYLIDPQGKLALTLPHAASPEQLIAAIRRHLPPIDGR